MKRDYLQLFAGIYEPIERTYAIDDDDTADKDDCFSVETNYVFFYFSAAKKGKSVHFILYSELNLQPLQVIVYRVSRRIHSLFDDPTIADVHRTHIIRCHIRTSSSTYAMCVCIVHIVVAGVCARSCVWWFRHKLSIPLFMHWTQFQCIY